MLALWVAALAVASSARLHSEVCPEAKEPAHDCVFTTVAQGHFSTASAPLTVARDVWVCSNRFLPAVSKPASPADVRLAPGRAPPSPFVVL
jgi:hypothetical protein